MSGAAHQTPQRISVENNGHTLQKGVSVRRRFIPRAIVAAPAVCLIGRRGRLRSSLLFAAARPLAARAQQQPVRPLIGILSPLSAASAARNIAAFRSGLRDLGYLEGRNATLEIRYWATGAPERMAPLAQELVALKPDVLVAGARSSVLAAQAATRTIPMVIITVDDPGETISGMLGHAPGRTSAGTGRHSCGHPRRSALGRRHRLFR